LGWYRVNRIKHRKDSYSSNEELVTEKDTPTILPIAADQNDTHHPGVSIVYKDIAFEIKGHSRHLVTSVSGSLQKGTLCGILGPSGAGKSKKLAARRYKALLTYTSNIYEIVDGED
jgi:ABC-type glutathione transport system ATPase component